MPDAQHRKSLRNIPRHELFQQACHMRQIPTDAHPRFASMSTGMRAPGIGRLLLALLFGLGSRPRIGQNTKMRHASTHRYTRHTLQDALQPIRS